MNIWKSITGVNAGEISPHMLHRIDFEKYHRACETAENFDIHLQGSWETRCGTQFINEVKTSADATRIITFQFNDSIEYTIEVGDLYFRFYKDGVRLGAPYELATPFQKEFLDSLVFSRASADVMYILSDYYPPYKLQRLGDTNWKLSRVRYDPQPTYIANTDLKTTLTPSAASGSGVTLTAGASVFVPADVDRILISGTARAVIVSYTSPTVVVADILDPFPNTALIASGAWFLLGSPAASCTPTEATPKGKIITLFLSASEVDSAAVDISITGKVATVTYNAHGLLNGDYVIIKDASPISVNGTWQISNVTTNTFRYTMKIAPNVPGGGPNSVCIPPLYGWRNSDIGKFVVINNGLCQILSIVNAGAAKVVIIKSIKDKTTIPAGLWSLEIPSFELTSKETSLSVVGITRTDNFATVTIGSAHGYVAGDYVEISGSNQTDYNGIHRIYDVPITTTFRFVSLNAPVTPATGTITVLRGQKNFPTYITFFQGACWIASTPQQPATYWRSVIDDYENFAKGSEDDASIDRTLPTFNRIKWLSSNVDNLAIGTDGEEFVVGANREGDPITPTSIRDVPHTSNGSAANISPVNIDNVTLFVQKATKKIFEYLYIFENNRYQAIDRTILAEHVTGSGLKRIVYMKEPEPIIWCLRKDGVLLRFLYKREEDIFCFSRYITDGLFKDICVTRNNNVEQLWVIVQRTISGTAKQYVELFNETMFSGISGWNWTRPQTDCAIKITNSPASTTVSGLGHLEGKEVSVLRDGILHPNRTVSSGSITLAIAGTNIEVGLPFEATLIPTRPEVQMQDGTAQGRIKGWSEVVVRLYNSIKGTINGEIFPDSYFSGDHVVYGLGYDLAGQLTFKRTEPLPLRVVGVSGKLDISTN